MNGPGAWVKRGARILRRSRLQFQALPRRGRKSRGETRLPSGPLGSVPSPAFALGEGASLFDATFTHAASSTAPVSLSARNTAMLSCPLFDANTQPADATRTAAAC